MAESTVDKIMDDLEKMVKTVQKLPEEQRKELFKKEIAEFTKSTKQREALVNHAVNIASSAALKIRKDFACKPYSEETKKKFKELGSDIHDRDPNDFESIPVAPAVGKFLDYFVHRTWGSGEYLTVEWALEYFWGLQIKEIVPTIEELWHLLKDNNYTVMRKYDVGWGDAYVWYIPYVEDPDAKFPAEKRIFVIEDHGRRYLVILDFSSLEYKIHVRRVYDKTYLTYGRYLKRASIGWYRQRYFTCEYGDARDEGYELTYTNRTTFSLNGSKKKKPKMEKFPKVEAAYAYYHTITSFIRQVNWIMGCLRETIKEETAH